MIHLQISDSQILRFPDEEDTEFQMLRRNRSRSTKVLVPQGESVFLVYGNRGNVVGVFALRNDAYKFQQKHSDVSSEIVAWELT